MWKNAKRSKSGIQFTPSLMVVCRCSCTEGGIIGSEVRVWFHVQQVYFSVGIPILYINSLRASVRRDSSAFNSPAEPTGRTGRACIFYGRTGGGPNRCGGGPTILPDGQWLRKVAKPACVRLSVTTGRREQWRWTQRKVTGKR
jgi:hypothetical protein